MAAPDGLLKPHKYVLVWVKIYKSRLMEKSGKFNKMNREHMDLIRSYNLGFFSKSHENIPSLIDMYG